MAPAIAINTLAYEGYDLTTALKEIARVGDGRVELGFTRGFTEGLTEAHFSEQSAKKIGGLMSDLGLESVALSAHTDLTTDDAVDELKRRIDFGKRLGANIINTKVGAVPGRSKFEANIALIAAYAQSMDAVIGLENPAEGTDQIITSGQTGAEVIRNLEIDAVKLNYDFGNAYTYSKGQVDPAEDYRKALPHACHLHLKDMAKIDEGWAFCQIGKGVVDYDAIFEELAGEDELLPISIETIYMYQASQDFMVHRLPQPLPLSYISADLKDSIDFVKSKFV